jgi:hypothetical protein
MRHLVELQPTRAELNERSEGAGVDPWQPSSGAGSPLAGVPVVLCDAEAAVSDLPRLFEALITEAVVEPIVTGLGGHDDGRGCALL